MNPKQFGPVVLFVVLHAVAALLCFTFFTVVPIGTCLVLMAIGNDPGGPMFFPLFVMGAILFAALTTAIIAGATLVSDLIRRWIRIPLWLPPLVVFLSVAGLSWRRWGEAHPVIPILVGFFITMAFIVHWAAISVVWRMPRRLFLILGAQDLPIGG
jgi:hypothetical protein